jgi:hypothetical protein
MTDPEDVDVEREIEATLADAPTALTFIADIAAIRSILSRLRTAEAESEEWQENWRDQARLYLAAVEALKAIRDELGVPSGDYAAPVANAVRIARSALKGETE